MQMALVYLWLSPVLGWLSFMDRPFLAMLYCPALAWSGSMKWLFLVLWAAFIGELTSATLITYLCDNPRYTAYKWVSLELCPSANVFCSPVYEVLYLA